jgi:glutathione S-transferase
MQGQLTHFLRFSPEKLPYAENRFLEETKRLYSVLQIRLGDQDRDWLAGPGKGKYSIADTNAWGWVRDHAFSGIESLDEWPAVKAWDERIAAHPSGQTGPTIPPW